MRSCWWVVSGRQTWFGFIVKTDFGGCNWIDGNRAKEENQGVFEHLLQRSCKRWWSFGPGGQQGRLWRIWILVIFWKSSRKSVWWAKWGGFYRKKEEKIPRLLVRALDGCSCYQLRRGGCCSSWFGVGHEGFSSRHVKLELSIRHPSRDGKQAIRHVSLNFGRKDLTIEDP